MSNDTRTIQYMNEDKVSYSTIEYPENSPVVTVSAKFEDISKE